MDRGKYFDKCLVLLNTSIFFIAHDVDLSSKQLNDDLKKVSDWVYQWKMSFNPDLSKQAQEVIFSRKAFRVDHPVVTFNSSPVARTPCQKHSGSYLIMVISFMTNQIIKHLATNLKLHSIMQH